MDEKELSELTRKTAERLFGPPKKGEGAYALWRQFNPELAKQFSLFFTGRLYAREVLSHLGREVAPRIARSLPRASPPCRWTLTASVSAAIVFENRTGGPRGGSNISRSP